MHDDASYAKRFVYFKGILKFAFTISIQKHKNKTEIANNLQFYSIVEAKIESFKYYKTKASPCEPHLD
jgi:hypothetical protein